MSETIIPNKSERSNSSETTEKLGREAYQRLGSIFASFSPYGTELAQEISAYLRRKLDGEPKDRQKWLSEDLKLNMAQKGLFDYDLYGFVAALNVWRLCFEYGAEDFIPLLQNATDGIRETGFAVPAKVETDMALVRDWMKDQYGIDI